MYNVTVTVWCYVCEMAEPCVIKQLLDKPFSQLKYEDKLLIVKNGKPTPPLPQLQCEQKEKNKNPYKRYFNANNYEKYLWLCGSCELNKLYCWPCLLFATEKTPWNTTGFASLAYLITALDKHQRSTSHIRSFTVLKTFGSQRVDHSLNLQKKIADNLHNEKVRENRNVLKRLIDAVVFLGKQESSFRGHDESDESLNKGNYIELLQFLANYDQVLSQHLKTATVFKGTSAVIQNDLIDALASVISDHIKSDINKATFVGIMLDETTDVTNRSQLSTVVRYVDDGGNCQERFLHFTDASSDRTARGLFEHVNKTVDNIDCSKKLVAQTFDGAAVMSGHVSGLQTLIKAQYPAATFIHCYSHRLNLILSQSVNFIKETRQFFVSLNGLPAFFSHSTSRTEALKAFTEKKMPSITPTRWNFASRLVSTVHDYRSHLIDFFSSIEDEPGDWSSEEVSMASGFLRFLSKIQSIFFLNIFSKIFAFSDVLFDTLQNKSMDISYCTEKINEFVDTLQRIRDTGFEEMWSQSVSDYERGEPRSKRRNCNEEEVYSRIFCEILDTVMSQTKIRFESQKQLKFVALLDCKRFDNYDRNFPTNIFCELKEPYSSYFDLVALKNELKVLYSLDEFSQKSVQAIGKYMKLNDLHTVYTEVYKMATLILTFPSTTASVERSFSALKRIKSYLRATQGQIRLSNLALLSIEKEILVSLRRINEEAFFDSVITKFTKKQRRLEFTYR